MLLTPLRKRVLSIAFCAFAASACATFADYPPKLLETPAGPRPVATLSVSVDAYMALPEGRRGYRVAPFGWPSLVRESLERSGLFSQMVTEPGEHQLAVSVALTTTQTPMSNALFAFLTAFLIPASDQRSLTVVVRIHDPHHQIDASAETRHEFRTWLQLFLLPLFFTHDPGSYEYEAAYRLSRSVTRDALRDWDSQLSEQ